MKNLFTILKAPAIIGVIIVLPFIILELVNRHEYHEKFPLPLFGILWFVLVLFFIILLSIIRNLRAANKIRTTAFSFCVRIAALILLAWFCIAIILDQMPCFLGVPNCD